ncbi:hypothetical protein PLICRDRAFT_534861 [Plicaturopsis crispa FD-325 SS-3]|nr:hypothetical protein PLICRDRAFT_534861 [Plicaturopsis crispa FD-325 SS-3]
MDTGQHPLARTVTLMNYMDLTGITILYFDMVLTFPGEVWYIWRRPKKFDIFRQYLLVVVQVVVSVVLILRTYAIYARSRIILIFLITLNAGLVAVGTWASFGKPIMVTTILSGCHNIQAIAVAGNISISWEVSFVFDLAVFALTIRKTYQRRHVQLVPGTMPIRALMFRDSAVYFAIMALLNLANILTNYLGSHRYLGGLLSTFASCISVTLISRLVLNLHKTARNAGILSHSNEMSAFVPRIRDDVSDADSDGVVPPFHARDSSTTFGHMRDTE